MIQQFKNLSSWRGQTVHIEPHELKQVDFMDTNPNQFVLVNPNLATLKVGIGSIPTESRYEHKVEFNMTETFGRPTPTRKLYILNDSSEPVEIQLFSVFDTFDISILKNLMVNIAEVTLDTKTVIQSFDVPLPTGGNHIGEVSLSSGENKIGFVGLLPEHLEQLNDKAKLDLIITNLSTLETDIHSLSEFFRRKDSVKLYQNNVTSFSYQAGNTSERIHFTHIFNDGDDAEIQIDGTTVFSIKTGEHIIDLEFVLDSGSSIVFNSTNPLFRIMYSIT